MRLSLISAVVATSLSFASSAAGQPAASPWADLAKNDLEEIHRLVATNHPGPVDPLNPGYRVWLEEGLDKAKARAASARSYFDYKRALQAYANGFRDGHMAVYFTIDSSEMAWPGFLPKAREGGGYEVGVSERDDIPVGSAMLACDGQPLDVLLAERVEPYVWNADIPHSRPNAVPRLLMTDADDIAVQPKACDLEIGGVRRSFDLQWRAIPRAQAAPLRRAALGRVIPSQGVRKVGDVWFVSLPTFSISPGKDTDTFRALLDELKAKAPELRRSTLVVDVRGNGGGNSDWGNEVARILWGDDWVARIGQSFDNTVDWRASADNLKSLEGNLERSRAQNLADGVSYYGTAVTAVRAALSRGESLARHPEPGKAPKGSPPPNPVTGRAYLLRTAPASPPAWISPTWCDACRA